MRVRFAPSPTGYLHIGSARTFIFNWLYARRNGGTMILRIDDTDISRNTQASLDSVFDGLTGWNWAGMSGIGNPIVWICIGKLSKPWPGKATPTAISLRRKPVKA